MLRALISLALPVALLLSSALPSLAEKRVALVIGNSEYRNATALKNPSNDAADMSAALKDLGFDVVLGQDLDAQGMRRTVREFADRLTGADVALFFYAGHALQVHGVNYLAPVDAELRKEADLDFETLSLDFVRRQMEREATTQLVFLDACRDNPLARRFITRSTANREGQGLARLDTAAEGTFIAFATQPDNVALDGEGRNSPFTTALLRNIRRPNVEISALMTDVRREVYSSTGQQQLPWTNSSLLGSFYFKQEQTAASGEAPAPRNAELEKLAREAADFETVKDADDIALLKAFLERHPGSIYEPLVRQSIERLSTPVEVASLPAPETRAPSATQPSAPVAKVDPQEEEKREMTREDIRSIQQELDRLGCDPGRPDGLWGNRSRSALQSYAEHADRRLASLDPSDDLLKMLKDHTGRICPAPAPPAREVVAPAPKRQTVEKPKRTTSATQQRTVTTKRPSSGNCFRFNGSLICE